MRALIVAALLATVAGAALAQSPQPQPQPQPRPQPGASPTMRATTPGLAAYTDKVLFGDVWQRPGLSPRDRSLVTVSALIAAGRAAQLTSHINLGLDHGLTPAEIAGLITHFAFYAGWPSAVSAVSVADEVFRQRGIDRAALRNAAEAMPQVAAADAARAASSLEDYTRDVVFGDVWRRTDLSPRDRSLATIAGLIAAGDMQQLDFYLARGVRNGLTRDELREAVIQLAFYAGWPKAMAASPLVEKALAASATGQVAR